MAKLLLVEDDNNLREIYEARLSAEGYEISTAQNGEEALSIAKQTHPDLIISDVMMPRISGFEMLDILRNTDELKNTKIIMLTALGQAEDRGRADNLGADRYLVKSQVTLEDIVQAAHDLLAGTPAQPVATPSAQPEAAAAEPAAAPVAVSEPDSVETPEIPVTPTPEPVSTQPAPEPAVAPAPAAAPVEPVAAPVEPVVPVPTQAAEETVAKEAASVSDEVTAIQAQIDSFATAPAPAAPAPVAEETTAPAPARDNANDDAVLEAAIDKLTEKPAAPAAAAPAPAAPSPSEPTGRKVIAPITDPAAAPDLNELLAKEEAKEPADDDAQEPSATVKPSPTSDAPIQQPKPADSIDPNSIAL